MNNRKKKINILSLFLIFCMLLSFTPVIYGSSSTNTSYSSGIVSSQQGGSSNCYDGVCFEGEIEGNSLISYENLISQLGITEGTKPNIPRNGYEEIYDKNAEEMSRGGIWLKFTDSKYTRDGKPRTYYVMKKPVRKSVSWNTLHTAGAVYGWDVIDEKTGLPKSNLEKYKNIGSYGTNKDYKAKILTINGEKYIVRLLQGRTNYGGDVSNTKIWDQHAGIGSEWNRTMLPITKGYRYGSNSINNSDWRDPPLADGEGTNYSKRSYKVQSAQYNWFGDLTLGSYYDWTYNSKSYKGLSSNYQGQYNWAQEFSDSSDYRASRGSGYTDYGAAYSNYFSSDNPGGFLGVRLVLEPFDN